MALVLATGLALRRPARGFLPPKRHFMSDSPRPTSIRYFIVLAAMLAAVLLYLERVCLSVAEVFIREDLNIDKDRMSYVLGAFFFSYALGQVPAGWLSQRYGPRLMMTLYMLGWSLFGVFIALAQDFITLFASRFLLGLSQAGAYPTAALLVKRWIPDRSRGMANSIVSFGGRFGGAGANWLTGILIVAFVPLSTPTPVNEAQVINLTLISEPEANPKLPMAIQTIRERVAQVVNPETKPEDAIRIVNDLIRNRDSFPEVTWSEVGLAADGKAIAKKPRAERTDEEAQRLNRLLIEKAFPGAVRQLHVQGWRPTLLIYGVLGIFVGAIFWFVARNSPTEHPWANEAERHLIVTGQLQAAQQAGSNAIPFRALAESLNQWYFSICQIFSNIGWVFLITLMPRFLDERYGVPVDDRGLMTTIPMFVAAVGMIGGGWATDRLSAMYGRRWGRALPMGVGKIPCVIALAVCPFLPSAWTVVIALTVMAVSQDFGIPAVWAFAQDTAGKQVGAVIGWANMWGNFGAGLAPILMRQIEKQFGWDGVLFSGSFAFLICGIFGMLTNAEKPLFPEQEKKA
jgi:MFS family permease